MRRNIFVSRTAIALVLCGALAALIALLYQTNKLIDEIERKELAQAKIIVRTSQLLGMQRTLTITEFNDLASQIISGNESLPVILVDETDSIYRTRNLPLPDSLMSYEQKERYLADIKAGGYPTATIELGDGISQTLYYGRSILIDRLAYIRVLQIVMVVLFAFVTYIVLSRVRRRERDTIWRGLALETAHQLGTPITSLGGWRDLLLQGYNDTQTVGTEMSHDIERLSAVAKQFSQVGSTPQMTAHDILPDLEFVVNYLQSRLPKRVSISLNQKYKDVGAPHNSTLIRWAVENICKNAADAITGQGSIKIQLSADRNNVIIDIEDTGKGMDPATRRRIFETGYTTKTRGWGIGLALVKRIMTEYHKGRVWVLSSQVGVGTTFRLTLPRK